MTEHTHVWMSLESQNAKIDVVRIRKDDRRVRSFYEIIEVCGDKKCRSGRTRDGVVFDDIHVGEEVPEDERVVRTTGRLTVMTKESTHGV